MRSVKKGQVLRLFIELAVLSLLLWWLPIWYQVGLSVMLIMLLELVYRYWQNHRLKTSLTSESIEKMVRNTDQLSKEN